MFHIFLCFKTYLSNIIFNEKMISKSNSKYLSKDYFYRKLRILERQHMCTRVKSISVGIISTSEYFQWWFGSTNRYDLQTFSKYQGEFGAPLLYKVC